MKQWLKSTLAVVLAMVMVLGYVLIPGNTLTAQAANTGNAQQDLTIFPSEMIDGVEWTPRFPNVTRLNDGTLIAAAYYHPVSLHMSWSYDDPKAFLKIAFGSADGKTWTEPTVVATPEYLGECGFGVWRDDAGNFYYDAEEAAANNASIQIELGNPNLHVMNDGTVLLDFFLRAPWEVPFMGKEVEDGSSSNSMFSAVGHFIMYSKDNGQSWSTPTAIPSQYLTRGFAKRGNIAEYDDGTLLIPLYGYDEYQSTAFHGTCVLAKLQEDGSWDFIRETLMWGATGTDTSTFNWDNEHALAVTTLNGQEVTYDLIRCSGNLLISYDRGITWEIAQADVEGNDSYFTGSTHERLQQPSLVNMDGSNKLIVTWTQAIGTLGQRNVYGKIYTPGEDWSKTTAVCLYKHNTRGGNDIGDATTIQLTNGELFTIYYDVASRRVGGIFSTVDELTMLRSETELNSIATAWNIYDIDFENYNAGDEVLVQNDLWMAVYGSTKNTVAEENGNKYLSTTTWANSGSNACWWFNNVSSDATVSFDFRFPDALSAGWQQLSLGLGVDWNDGLIVFNNMAGKTQFGVYNTTLAENVFAAGENWYSVKIIWDDYKAYVKLWQKGTAEPAQFTHTFLCSNFNVEGKIFLKVAGGSTNGERVQVDNICISKKTNLSIVEIDKNTLGYRFDRDVTYELPVPQVTWSSSDPSVVDVDQNGKLTYNGGVGTAVITAACNNLKATKEITVSGWNIYNLDFENDAAGDWVVPSTYGMSFTNYNKAGATKTIVEENGNKYLKINHNAKFVSEIWFPAGPNVTMQFDYQLPTTITTGWHSLVIAPVNNLNYTWQINNMATSNVRFVNAGALTNIVNNAMSVGANSPWYTAKITRNGTSTTMTVWERSNPDTILYNQTVTSTNFTGDKMCIKLANDAQNTSWYLDNIKITKTAALSIQDDGADQLSYSFSPDVTAETPVPNVVWSSSDENVVKVDASGNLTYVGAGTATITATCDNLTATKEITVCAVSFDANGHGENPATVLVRSGNTVTAPEMADNGDYIFKGWYNGKTAFDFNAPITESVTLTAKWVNKNDLYYFDFEDVEPGNYLVQDGNGLWMDNYESGWSWVEVADDNQHLVLSGAEGTATTDFWFNNVPVGTTVSFDFAMPTTSAGWDRLAIAFGSSDVNYSWRFEQWQGWTSVKYPNVYGEEQVANEAFAIGTWYSVKMDWNGDQICVKIWERGTEEPADYTFTTQNACFTADSKVRINYVTDSQSYLHLDNIRFYDANEPTVEAWNITLGDNIGLNFCVDIDETLVSQSAVEITVGGAAVNAIPVKNQDGKYVYTIGLAAAQMTEEVQVKVLLDGAVAECKTYTVRQYADVILAGDYSEETKNLVRAMLVYGGKAQNYFSHNTVSYADVGIELEAADVPTVVDPMTVSGSVDGLTYYGASMLFTSKNVVRYYFVLSEGANIGDYTFTAGNKTLTPAQKNGMYYVDVAEINPQDLDESIEVVVTYGTQNLTVGYSPMNYIVRMYGKGSDELKALLQAMYTYHLAAEAYLATV